MEPPDARATSAILAIDAGTTGVTALVVTPTGLVVADGYAQFPQYFPADGQVEHELGEIWAATLTATREALAKTNLSISAIGIANQRETICFWDRETLGSARRAIVWQDRRTAEMCEQLRAAGHEPKVTALTGLRLDPYFSATKIAWVRENDEQTWSQVLSGRVAIGTIDSYLIARMTRGLHHVTDATNASRTMLYNLRTGVWDPWLCSLFGVPIDALASIVSSYGVVGNSDPASFLGLDVPIAGIAGDQQAALVGQVGFTAGAAKCTYGTGSFLLVHTGAQPAASTTGLGAPDWEPYARGLIIGITRGTTKAHLARATLDAIAYEVVDVVQLMRSESGIDLSNLAVDGGAAANNLLCQLQADALGIPVDRSAELQTTGLGAAFLAGLGTGVWTSTEELIATRRSSGIFSPGAADPIGHARWRAAVRRSTAWASD